MALEIATDSLGSQILRNSVNGQVPSLKDICGEVSWVRPNDGIVCTMPIGHSGDRHGGAHVWDGPGDPGQNVHDNPGNAKFFHHYGAFTL